MAQHRSQRISWLRVAIVVAALLAASLPSAAPAAAVVKCDGKVATIVGTKGDDNGRKTIRGTPRRDIINARGGDDEIRGRGGRDLICGSGGGDTIGGGPGNDRIFGGGRTDVIVGEGGKDTIFGGDDRDLISGDEEDDVLLGGPGNDFMLGGDGDDTLLGQGDDDDLDGEAGTDDCRQGPGTGTIVNCEPKADFAVTVSCPANAPVADIVCEFTVTNNGPADAAYAESTLGDFANGGDLECPQVGAFEPEPHPMLADGDSRTEPFPFDCTSGSGTLEVGKVVMPIDAVDPTCDAECLTDATLWEATNNHDSDTVSVS